MHRDSDNWTLLQQLFHLAEETPAEDRERVLAEQCQDKALVRRALQIFQNSASLEVDQPAPPADAIAGRIGPYLLIRLLGSGGIGSVYLAERILGGAAQRSALKMLSPHAAGPSFIERFHREQHILASLDHSNITRLLDAGLTEAGQPYLVMEYVEGEHLDAYCDARKLGISERLGLFLQVCHAVDYAHRNLIVHLDLKPSNIMVTGNGETKLLDFGTSKLIRTDSQMTTTVLATPAYASPEQLRNEPVTTACDVYSLGAVLAELLAGKRSTRRTSAAVVMERALSGQEPERLEHSMTPGAASLRSTTEPKLRQALKGDLSVITAKCLRANPSDRYRSVEALAEDIRRHLSGRTVLATPQTISYQLMKFVSRNRTLAAVSMLAFLILAGALGYAAMRQREALRQGQRAVQMQTLMTQIFQMANVNYMGKPAPTLPEFLKLGVAIAPHVIRDPVDQRAAVLSLAESMYANEAYQDALPVLQRVIDQATASHDIPTEAEAEAYAGRVDFRLGRIGEATPLSAHAMQLAPNSGIEPRVRLWIRTFYTQDRYELSYSTDADVAIERAAIREAQGRDVPENDIAYADMVLALLMENTHPLKESEDLIEKATAIYRTEPYDICDMAIAERLLGADRAEDGDQPGSLALYRSSYDGFRQCKGGDSYEALLAAGYVGAGLFFTGQPGQTIQLLETTVPQLEKVGGSRNPSMYISLLALSRSYIALGRYENAEHAAVSLFQAINGSHNPDAVTVGNCHWIWAQALVGEGRLNEALVHAKMADASYASRPSLLPLSRAHATQNHQLVLDLEARLAQKPPASLPPRPGTTL
jgi:serine/threonine-protein kinase